MIDNRRILAVKMDSELFDEMKKQLKEMGLTSQKFINDLVAKEIDAIKLSQQQSITADIQPKTLNREDVEKALNLPEERELICIVPIGYPAESPACPKRKTVDDLLTII